MKRPVFERAFAACLGVVILVLGLATTACDRTPRLVPATADSLAARDSLAILSRMASDQWNNGHHEEASSMTARVLRMRLAAVPTPQWVERSRVLLDSLGIAAEVVGQGPVLAVNLFSRVEAQGATWPFVFWREADGVRMQVIEGRNQQLMDAAARGFVGDVAQDSSQVAVLWGRKSGFGYQPMLISWRHATGGRWDLAQTLGADSLGGTGTGSFRDGGLVVSTWGATPYFDENCSSCPHVRHQRTFRWTATGFERVEDRIEPSPYVTFTTFLSALIVGGAEDAQRHVADPSLVTFARRLEWHDPALGRWSAAPGSDPNATTIVFHRGRKDAFRVSFQSRGAGWVITGFEAIERRTE